MTDEPGIGHNLPPPLADILRENQARLLDEMVTLASRANDAPKTVADEIDLEVVGEIVRDSADLWQRMDLARKMEKEPFLKSGRTVDEFFKSPLDRIDRVKQAMVARASAYQTRVAEEARRKAEAEARAAREEEAQRTEWATKAKRQDHALTHAAKADEARARAMAAETAAAAPAKEITRTITSSGLTAGAREEWVFEIENYAAVPLDGLRPYFKRDAVEAAIRLAVKQGVRDIEGVKIHQQLKATFR